MFEKLKASFNTAKEKWQLNRKLSQLARHAKGTPQEIKATKDLLQELVKYDIGRDVVMNMPQKVSIQWAEKKGKKAVAYFEPLSKQIVLCKAQQTDADRKQMLIALAHEMRHAVQTNYSYGMSVFSGYSPKDQFAIRKMCELETQVQDTVFESQLYSNDEADKKSPDCQFYDAEKQRFKALGLSDEQAEKKAKTSVAQIYWSGLTDKPENCSPISAELAGRVRAWNNCYDLQVLKNTIMISKKMKEIGLDEIEVHAQERLDISRALSEEFDKEFLPDESTLKSASTDQGTSLLQTCVDQMGLDKSASYFMDNLKDRTTVGDSIVLQANENGAIKSALFLLPNGHYALREYNENAQKDGKMVCTHEVVYNKSGAKDGFEIFGTNDGKIDEVFPYKNGFREGMGMLIDHQNKKAIVARYENGSAKYYLTRRGNQITVTDGNSVLPATQEQEEEYNQTCANFLGVVKAQISDVSETYNKLATILQEKSGKQADVSAQTTNNMKQATPDSAVETAQVMAQKRKHSND